MHILNDRNKRIKKWSSPPVTTPYWWVYMDKQTCITIANLSIDFGERDPCTCMQSTYVHVYIYTVGDTDEKILTADMNKNNHKSGTKDEMHVAYDKPLIEENHCESPAGGSDDKSSAGYTHDKLSMQGNQPLLESEEKQPLHAGWLKKFGWSFI